jgi:hypothetical protein
MNNYNLTIDNMKWSYSRLNSFYECAYCWKLQYIDENKSKDGFFGEYGSFMHEILEKFAKNELSMFELSSKYEEGYNNAVKHRAPPNAYVDLGEKYYNIGKEYLDNFEGFGDYEILDVEKKVDFTINNIRITGFIDLLAKNKDAKLAIIDHKSADLKPRSSRKKVTKGDEKLDSYLRQLYMYSIPVFEEFGEYPVELNFNAFRSGVWIREPFDMKKLEETKKWIFDTIDLIKAETLWLPKSEEFWCKWICSMRHKCEFSRWE